ncbi:unnamed protein product [Rotaria sp. Silwood1]|nr:unnamed protein product [Rotaria sp. Silwood1]
MNNTIEHAKVQKSLYRFDEIRDVPISHYVCQWWITQFQDAQVHNQTNPSIAFKKKHRDQIRYTRSMLPFRRSGLWMTIKAVLHTILQETYQHPCRKLKEYIDQRRSGESSRYYFDRFGYRCLESNRVADRDDDLPRFLLTNHDEDSIGIVLTRAEIWIQYNLAAWIDSSLQSGKGDQTFEKLQNFYENYQNAALNWYYSKNKSIDPIGYSRFILTSLTIIRLIHKTLCEDGRFQRLKLHAIRIPNLLELFEFLVLPNRNEMFQARTLYDYFQEFSKKTYPDLLSNIESRHSFGVQFADQSPEMNETLEKIQEQIEQDKKDKTEELNKAKKKYEELMKEVIDLKCECETDVKLYYKKCDRCKFERTANNIKVDIYECPIPSERESALAVIFELQMPNEIRCYRDILWLFANRPNPKPSHKMYEWLSSRPHGSKLAMFYKGPRDCKVQLLSAKQSLSETHYSAPRSIASTPLEDFFYENSLQVQITPTRPTTLQDECRTLTPELSDPNYKSLQFSIESTQFVQNKTIANLSKCTLQLKPIEFLEFGSFRSGHRLQWWNLLSALETDSLSIDEESVAVLITHALLQNGPFAIDGKALIYSWCPESHQQLLEDHFVDELIVRLERHLKDFECNWQNELVLIIITVVVIRIFTICNSTRKQRMIDLVLKCRHTGAKWIQLILKSIHNPSSSDSNKMDALRDKIGIIGIACLLTFSVYTDASHSLDLSNDDVMSLLNMVTTVHDNLILGNKKLNMSVFMRNLMRQSERVLVSIHPMVKKLLEKNSYELLNEFASIYWAVIRTKGKADGKWKKRSENIYDGWYDGQYESNNVSIDCFNGKFVVNDQSIGFLPNNITSDKLFQRVFGNHIFEVQRGEQDDTYITKHGYHHDEKVHYEFNRQNYCLRIYEHHAQTNDRFELIPPKCFEDELAEIFVSNYSHWWNDKTKIVEFRPVHFQHENFLHDIHYILAIKKGFIRTNNTENRQYLINRSSSFFKNLFTKYFIRLDGEPYVYMLADNGIINIHLSRLGIAFKYSPQHSTITSREYFDMHVDENQCFGTLTGLRSGLLLSPMATIEHKNRHQLCRKLIVPYGEIRISKKPDRHHQTVTIDRTSESKSPFLHQYFVFILNDRLRILQPTDSPTGWLYLALLHAVTSHCLPDQYTGMTGMERSFELLNSAGSWSDQPFDPVCRQILLQIAIISPQVNYYSENNQSMEKIEWNPDYLPYSLQHFGYYLIAKKLLEASEEWNFMYSTSATPNNDELEKLFKSKKYNENLLMKLYWDYRDSYNPLARLSPQMEAEIQRASVVSSYKPVWENSVRATNYSSLRLIDNLYGSGDVDLKDSSQLRCFPLSRWLSSEYQLKNIWIGLFKLAEELKTVESNNRQDDIERFEFLLDFLHYISDKCSYKPFYLQMLKSIIRGPSLSLRSLPYPSFTRYENIEEISFQRHRIKLPRNLGRYRYPIANREIEDCFLQNRDYENESFPDRYIRTFEINCLFKSWRRNSELRLFINNIQNHVRSIVMVPFHTKVSVNPQRFGFESFRNHYQIHLKLADTNIDQKLLESARLKFMHPHSDYFIKLTACVRITNEKKEFPKEIFPSTDSQVNLISDIAKYFKEHLAESWNQFNMLEEYRKEYPSLNITERFLHSLRQESRQNWSELGKSIIFTNQLLFKTGLAVRFLPTTLLSVFHQTWLNETEINSRNAPVLVLTPDQRTLLGGIMVNWVVEQQIERALHFGYQKKWEDFEREISNVPHANWVPSQNLPWLIIELEMNITIREIQVEVARHMTQPIMNNNDFNMRNTVMQLNMGEGKTSVIVPMLALSLCSSSSSLVRIIVLKSLFPTNYQSLRHKLGGLLNRRVLSFACRRDMNFSESQANQIFNRLQYGLSQRDVVLTSPEDILSFDLLTIDKCRRNEFDVGRPMLSTQRWIKTYVRDILDESDEILHVKYQLIYSIGGQKQVDGGLERWQTIQSVLNLVKQHATSIATEFNDDVSYKVSERKSSFPEFRLLNHRPFLELCKRIAKDWLNQKNFRQSDEELILQFILDISVPITCLKDRFPYNIIQLFLVMRGLLSSEVLFVTLKKRYRVNFGVNPNPKFNRLMAVPFRAKDVAAENTEFGHPDVALVLTQISYYYSGLSDLQLRQCFDRLSQNENDPEVIYNEWISLEEDNDTIARIKQWKQVNLKDKHQRTEQLFPTFRRNMQVINYFLNNFVYPYESKQFPHKLIASPWDLSSSARKKIMTGFSGTNDTQLLLPVHIHQCDLPELKKTDAVVLNNLLQPKNEHYRDLPISASSEEILKQIVNTEPMIQVILDVGALFIDGSNRQIAIKWLDLSNINRIDYVVYFEMDSIFVCDRQYQHHAFSTAPASERLDRCLFYLDEIHTRGTDFKFPNEFRAAVTLGNGLTKDRLVQACMRMRKLGKHHWLSFWSSSEVHHQVQTLKKTSALYKEKENVNDHISLTDILRWVYENTQQAIWDGLHHWATQSLSFQQKNSAFRNIDWNNYQQILTNIMMENLAKASLEAEILDLKTMYGHEKIFQTVYEIYSTRYQYSNTGYSTEIHEAVSKRLLDYGGSKKLLTQLLDEEQQRELEREQETEEERQQVRPIAAVPCEPILHHEVMNLCETQGPMLNLSHLPNVFCPIADAFIGMTFYRESQPGCWQENLWITTEFKRVIQTKGESLDPFLRPPRWVLIYRNQHIIFLSPYEANELMDHLQYLYHKSPSDKLMQTTLRLLLPRTRRDQSILFNTRTLTIPPLISFGPEILDYSIPIELLVALFAFNGTIYFENKREQDAYCKFLGLCLKPRNEIETNAFDNGWINIDGFVENLDHRQQLQLHQCRFSSNPLSFIRKLIENRNQAHAPLSSHVGSIIINAIKLPIE